jgi:hypothetical protein
MPAARKKAPEQDHLHKALGNGHARISHDELARVYHLGSAAGHVRDPRTGERSNQPRAVLDGAIEPFLLAYWATVPFERA